MSTKSVGFSSCLEAVAESETSLLSNFWLHDVRMFASKLVQRPQLLWRSGFGAVVSVSQSGEADCTNNCTLG